MSGCIRNFDEHGRHSKWQFAEWHTPDGRTIWAIDKPTMVEVDISDGTTRHYPLALRPDERVVGIKVNGRRWRECQDKDYDNIDSVREVDR